jgi:microcin C transport system permease protein
VFVGYAIPGWVAGILMIMVFASHWDFFPLGELVSENFETLSVGEKALNLAWHSLLPLTAYLIGAFSFMTFLMKNTLMDNLAADYVRTAMAKGLTFRRAVFGHALRNSLIPIATTFGNNISVILSGSFLVEKVFNIDGMGLLGYESVVERDYPVVMGVLAISSILFLVGNILSDMCVAAVDPRVKFE